MPTHTPFDKFATQYDAALGKGLALTGEGKDYYAHGRVRWLARCLSNLGERPEQVMDFGCGEGSTSKLFFNLLGARHVLGVESSPTMVDVAESNYGSQQVRFTLLDHYVPDARMDLVYCNGVFHHIPLDERAPTVDYIRRSLRPGGVLALWENNPWNPGTRLIMSRIPFDRDAIMLSSRQVRRMLRVGGFKILRTDYLFFFPKALQWFRRVEPWLCSLPFGGQFQVLCRKQ